MLRRHLLQLALAAATPAGQSRSVLGLRLRWCPPGSFQMGSPLLESGRRSDESPVQVTLTQGFWMGAWEVTQSEWLRIAGPFPRPMDFGQGEDFPVYWVTWHDAERFCIRLTELARRSGELEPGWEFRLPAEAQWEYACRAGTQTPFAFGQTLTTAQANISRTINRAVKAASYPPNPWGIHDMHGNIFEWCRDWYHARLPGGTDPDLSRVQGEPNRDGTFSRVRRGGAWNDEPHFCRSALRLRYEPHRNSDHIGFRVVATKSA